MKTVKNCYLATGIEMLETKLAEIKFEYFLKYMPMILDLTRGMTNIEKGGTFDLRGRGYLTLMDGITGKILFTIPFGRIPNAKLEEHFKLSQEGATRLFNVGLLLGHTTSYESRDPSKDQYGGAIYVNLHSTVVILSFAGSPELLNEAMMTVLAKGLSIEVCKPIRTKIEAFERNPYSEQMYLGFIRSVNKAV